MQVIDLFGREHGATPFIRWKGHRGQNDVVGKREDRSQPVTSARNTGRGVTYYASTEVPAAKTDASVEPKKPVVQAWFRVLVLTSVVMPAAS
jgi:hypothetical protein